MKIIPFVVCALASINAVAQTNDEAKAAADRLLSQDGLQMQYRSSSGWSTTVQTNLKTGTSRFPGSRDTFCYGNSVPTTVAYQDTELVVAFKSGPGCQMPQYRFDPVTGAGKVLMSPDNGATWEQTPNSRATIQLIVK